MISAIGAKILIVIGKELDNNNLFLHLSVDEGQKETVKGNP
jgi:hypothetical protein